MTISNISPIYVFRIIGIFYDRSLSSYLPTYLPKLGNIHLSWNYHLVTSMFLFLVEAAKVMNQIP